MSALFTAEELRRLDRIRLRPPRPRVAPVVGDWRSRRHGAGGLFADHREYAPGDDLRYVDWNVYARLGDLVVKRFEAEEAFELVLCVDRSGSMQGTKARAARRLAAALGYVTLAHADLVQVAWMPSPSARPFTTHRGARAGHALLEEFTQTPDQGTTDHGQDVARVLAAHRRHGMAVVVSDFYDPADAVASLSRLRARGMDVVALHVLDVADIELPLGEALWAVDQETGQRMKIDVTRAFLRSLRQTWHRRAASLQRWCVSRGVMYERIDVRSSLWELLPRLMGRGLTVGAT